MDQKLVDYVDYGLESSGYVNYGLESSGLCGLWTRNQWTMRTMDLNIVEYVEFGLESNGLCGL